MDIKKPGEVKILSGILSPVYCSEVKIYYTDDSYEFMKLTHPEKEIREISLKKHDDELPEIITPRKKVDKFGLWNIEKLPEDDKHPERIRLCSNTTTITIYPSGEVNMNTED